MVLGRDHLERVIPIAQTSVLEDSQVTLISLEAYNGGFALNYRIRSLEEKEAQKEAFRYFGTGQQLPQREGPSIGFPEANWKATDDLGNEYQSLPEGSGGSPADYHGTTAFVPKLSEGATQLIISSDEIRWVPVNRRQKSLYVSGPWRFEIPLT
jgi:Family of unknown function (DUF5643)